MPDVTFSTAHVVNDNVWLPAALMCAYCCHVFFTPKVISSQQTMSRLVDCHTREAVQPKNCRTLPLGLTTSVFPPANVPGLKYTEGTTTANRLSDYVPVTLNTATILCAGHILAAQAFSRSALFIWVSVLMGNVTAAQTNQAARTDNCVCVGLYGAVSVVGTWRGAPHSTCRRTDL